MRALSHVTLVALSLLALGAVTGACAVDGDDDGDAASSEDELRALSIKDGDNGKTFTVPKGKDIKVVLSANATTGYKWKVVSTDRTFGYPSPKEGTYAAEGGGSGPVGGGGKHTFVWKTSSPLLRPSSTAHAVKLEYRRSFESDDTPATKTFTFKIKISEGAAPPPPEPVGEPITLFEEHDGATLRAKTGQDVIVRLPENPSTGYAWYVESTDRTFGYGTKEFAAPSASGPVGSGGTAVFTWKTSGPLPMLGAHTVKLKSSRGESGAAAKHFTFTVNIVAADADTEFTCPPSSMTTINCMPPVSASRAQYCARDFRTWAQANCDVSYLD
jgi:inhibitor of cysteine peptidase